MVRDACLYFHSPCFDGIASAVLALDFLEVSQNWKFNDLRGVDYDRRDGWLSQSPNKPFAVVDFLYHPNAEFWADHHQTSFLTIPLRRDFKEQQNLYHIYNPRIGSCAMLLWRVLQERFNYQNSRYAALARWAHKIDA